MADEVIKLQSLRKEDIPADLRAETYFDFNTHPFEHRRLLEQADSVYAAILGIDEYATKWLADTIAKKRSAAKAFNNKAPKPAHIIGNFEVLLEDGVVFEPARIIGRVPARTCGNASAGALRGPSQKDEGSRLAGSHDLRYSIYVGKDARVIGTDIYLEKGSIYIGAGTTVEPGVGIKGPVIIGKETELRQGAYLRGDCIIGNGCVIRGEIKNCVLMDKANFPHPSYLGDSLCGYMTHFGNQATTANLGIFAGLVEKHKRKPLVIRCNGRAYDIGNPKMGICMGDYSQVGCNCVSDPGTFLKPYTITYSLARISKGFYGPNEILKNKPLEHGVIERSPYKPQRLPSQDGAAGKPPA